MHQTLTFAVYRGGMRRRVMIKIGFRAADII